MLNEYLDPILHNLHYPLLIELSNSKRHIPCLNLMPLHSFTLCLQLIILHTLLHPKNPGLFKRTYCNQTILLPLKTPHPSNSDHVLTSIQAVSGLSVLIELCLVCYELDLTLVLALA